jgi:hypothetical protein
MTSDFPTVFNVLKSVFTPYTGLSVQVDTPAQFTMVTKTPSPFPQHKGQPMFFGSVRLGRAYVSFHLMPLYMCDVLTKRISPALKKRMQGKTCFNFKTDPGPELMAELHQLTEAGFRLWGEKNWI